MLREASDANGQLKTALGVSKKCIKNSQRDNSFGIFRGSCCALFRSGGEGEGGGTEENLKLEGGKEDHGKLHVQEHKFTELHLPGHM